MRILSIGLSSAAALLLATFAFAAPQQIELPAPPSLDDKVSDVGFWAGSPVMIRIFKRESELELWLRKDDKFQLYATYPICFWSGKLGPKQREGDKQAPEGFYSVAVEQLHVVGRHPRSLNIGYPNALDRALRRTGSYILLHGGCTSVGCFAMTDPIMEEIYGLSAQALGQGQDRIAVHIFPFRMTEANMAPYANSRWYGFWRNLKEGYDALEGSQVPPNIRVCRGRYVIGGQALGDQLPIDVASDDCAPQAPMVVSAAGAKRHRLRLKRVVVLPRMPGRLSGYSGRKAGASSQRSRIATRVRPGGTAATVAHRRAH